MLEFITEPQNMAFSIAIAVVAAIALVEAAGALIGAGLSDLLDSMLPDLDGPPGAAALTWIGAGQVPVLIGIVVHLTTFALSGLAIQALAQALVGTSTWLAVPGAIALGWPLGRAAVQGLAALLPAHESSVVSRDDFLARPAVITQGTARRGSPAQARLSDEHGQQHWIRVEPEDRAAELATGTQVRIIARAGDVFQAVRIEHHD